MRTRIIRRFSIAAVLGALALIVPRAEAQETRPAGRERLQWGIYHILWSRSYGKRLRREVARFASKPDYVMFYRDLDRPFPRLAVDAVYGIGATPVVSLELWRWHGGRKGNFLPAIVGGHYDGFLRAWAGDARNDGRRILLRFGFEFNGDWFSWSRDPKVFIAAWRRAHAIFRQEKADNVEWVWSPNVRSSPDTPENNMHLYYPGDEYVDWVSVDGYNFGDDHDKWHHWQSFEEIFGQALGEFKKRYSTKPIIISEVSCAPGKGTQRPQWIRDAYATLMKWPQVKAVVWFNYDKRREKEPNWRIDTTAQSLRAFNETFAGKRFRRSVGGDTGTDESSH